MFTFSTPRVPDNILLGKHIKHDTFCRNLMNNQIKNPFSHLCYKHHIFLILHLHQNYFQFPKKLTNFYEPFCKTSGIWFYLIFFFSLSREGNLTFCSNSRDFPLYRSSYNWGNNTRFRWALWDRDTLYVPLVHTYGNKLPHCSKKLRKKNITRNLIQLGKNVFSMTQLRRDCLPYFLSNTVNQDSSFWALRNAWQKYLSLF